MRLPALLAECARSSHLRFLLIGGHAVIAHGYARTTFDVDLLVRKEQRAGWVELLYRLDYALAHEAAAFLQFTPADGENLDLMLVNDPTFEGLWAAAVDRTIGGSAVKIPSLDHLIALKLHVLKQDLGHRVIKDLDDVIRIVLANRLELRTDYYRQLFEKYGTIEDYQRVLRAIGQTGKP